jgi:acyl-coenzyme A thioesterase PaaI-like protein
MQEENVLEIEKEDIKEGFTELLVLEDIKQNHHYQILEIRENYAKTLLKAGQGEVIDNKITLFDGEIFSAAAFSVLAAINMKNTTILDSQMEFLQTISIEDDVVFEASAASSLSSKRHVNVKAYVREILIFEGAFSTIRLDSKSKILE